MKAASLSEIKKELKHRSQEELLEFCLALSRFKLESKELMTYLLFEKDNEEGYRQSIKTYITSEMQTITTSNAYYAKKSIRKVLRQIKRFIRYSKNKETEAVVLMHFCTALKQLPVNYKRSRVLTNLYNKQLEMAQKAIAKLHEDLQYDLQLVFEEQFAN